MKRPHHLATIGEGLAWLRDNAILDTPTRLHDRALGDDGAPRVSNALLRWITRDEWSPGERASWAFEVTESTTDEPCPKTHPIRKREDQVCDLCGDQLAWKKHRAVYVRPFAAALWRLKAEQRAYAPTWPAPYDMIVALLRADYDPGIAAAMIGKTPISDDHRAMIEAAFLMVVRKLYGKWSSGPLERPSWVDRSESQQNAEGGIAAA